MKINEIIRERRIAKGFTQEQMASYLGISAPAVNKWEKAISYPDITLLPALARLLETDLNTLLSFKEELSKQEVENFLNELVTIATTNGIETAFSCAMNKIKEYPSCDSLILNTALTLEGILSMYIEIEEEKNLDFLNKVEELYVRVIESKDMQVANQAKSILISKYMQRQEFEQAEKLLNELPDEGNMVDKKQLQARLFMNQGNLDKAISLIEQKLLLSANSMQSSLWMLMEINLKEGNISDAEQIAKIASEMVSLFDLWEYGSYIAPFQLSVVQKDTEKCLQILRKMLPAMIKTWSTASSFLYRHINEKKGKENLGELMLPKILNDLENSTNSEYDFIRDNPEFQKLIAGFKKSVSNK